MTPAARIAAAIELLDQIIDGASADQSLTRWGRAHRYAGSKDRAAIRDHVFDALRHLKSYAALGGSMQGRGVMIGALRAQDIDLATIFTGDGYAPSALSDDEQGFRADALDRLTALDCPEWLGDPLQAALGADFAPIMQLLQQRAPVFLRVNNLLSDIVEAADLLAGEGIQTKPHPLSRTALEVTQNPRRVRNAQTYLGGKVELQDAGSQAISDRIPTSADVRVLDFCAGGGGKSLALAGHGVKNIFAYDVNENRLRDLPKRAERAEASVEIMTKEALKNAPPFELILADVPCSGSGSWRRNPAEKWQFTPEKLDELCAVQAGILDEIVNYAADDAVIAYITCSLLHAENQDQIIAFQARHPNWVLRDSLILTPLDGGDGFFLALLSR